MKRAALLIPLLLLAGCRCFTAYDPRTHVFLFAGSMMTTPAIGEAEIIVKTPTTQETLVLKGYSSKSEVKGSDLTAIGRLLAIP